MHAYRAQHGIYFFLSIEDLTNYQSLTDHIEIAIMRIHSWSCIRNQYLGVAVNTQRVLFWLLREGKQLEIFIILV